MEEYGHLLSNALCTEDVFMIAAYHFLSIEICNPSQPGVSYGPHRLLAQNGEAVRHASELGGIVSMDTASAEHTEVFVRFAIHALLSSQ